MGVIIESLVIKTVFFGALMLPSVAALNISINDPKQKYWPWYKTISIQVMRIILIMFLIIMPTLILKDFYQVIILLIY